MTTLVNRALEILRRPASPPSAVSGALVLGCGPGLSGGFGAGMGGLFPPPATSGPEVDALLLETGDYLLLETGDYLLLE